MKTVRFSQVVEKSGRPESYTLWSAPKDDPAFQRAAKQHRVMTVHQENTGAKSDFGEVGYTEDRQGSLLIFPKSLEPFAGRRVIGIKYDLLETPRAAPAPARAKKPVRAEPPKPSFPPLQVLPAPMKATAPPKPVAPPPAPPEEPAAALARLTREVRRALQQLKAGKAVAAYQTLEAALP